MVPTNIGGRLRLKGKDIPTLNGANDRGWGLDHLPPKGNVVL